MVWYGRQKLPQVNPFQCIRISLLFLELWKGRLPLSADVYSFFTIVLGSKNYPKMTPHTLKSAHRVKSYSQNIEMLWPPNLIDGSLQIQFRQKGGSFFDL